MNEDGLKIKKVVAGTLGYGAVDNKENNEGNRPVKQKKMSTILKPTTSSLQKVALNRFIPDVQQRKAEKAEAGPTKPRNERSYVHTPSKEEEAVLAERKQKMKARAEEYKRKDVEMADPAYTKKTPTYGREPESVSLNATNLAKMDDEGAKKKKKRLSGSSILSNLSYTPHSGTIADRERRQSNDRMDYYHELIAESRADEPDTKRRKSNESTCSVNSGSGVKAPKENSGKVKGEKVRGVVVKMDHEAIKQSTIFQSLGAITECSDLTQRKAMAHDLRSGPLLDPTELELAMLSFKKVSALRALLKDVDNKLTSDVAQNELCEKLVVFRDEMIGVSSSSKVGANK